MTSVRTRLDSGTALGMRKLRGSLAARMGYGIVGAVIGLGAAVAILIQTGPADGATQADSIRAANAIATPSKRASPSVLFVQMARGGSLSRANRRGRATLTLKGVSRATVFFSDRPERFAGQTATGSFVEGWRRRFGSDPPNAALRVLRRGTGRDVAVELLRRPSYNARTATLTYRIRRLDDADAGLFPSRFRDASLFIDSAPDTDYVMAVTLADGSSYGSVVLEDIRGVTITATGNTPDDITLGISQSEDESFRFTNLTTEAHLGVALSTRAQPDVPFTSSSVSRDATWEYNSGP
jgi:hypothetical protein